MLFLVEEPKVSVRIFEPDEDDKGLVVCCIGIEGIPKFWGSVGTQSLVAALIH